jgi:hypothetical protein
MTTDLAIDVELCPECGDVPRWVGSEPPVDYWACPCSAEFTITVMTGLALQCKPQLPELRAEFASFTQSRLLLGIRR